jgi:salicylate hydroxylase
MQVPSSQHLSSPISTETKQAPARSWTLPSFFDLARTVVSHLITFFYLRTTQGVEVNMTAPEHPPTIAIVGGGIAGLTLTIALLTHCPYFTITLYESAAAFGEIGAGVGFEPVMVRTMALIDPRIKVAFERCAKGNTVTDPPRFFTVRVGDQRKANEDGVVLERDGNKIKLGEELYAIPSRKGPRGGIHRAHFLDELVKLIPDGVAQFRKKLVNVRKAEDGSGS